MKKIKIPKVWSIFLAFVVVFTSRIQISNTLEDVNNFDIDSTVTYENENKNATISLDLESVGEGHTVEEIKDPKGNTMDLTDLNYIVEENGTYEFTINYRQQATTKNENGEVATQVEENGEAIIPKLEAYTKEIIVDGIKVVNENTPSIDEGVGDSTVEESNNTIKEEATSDAIENEVVISQSVKEESNEEIQDEHKVTIEDNTNNMLSSIMSSLSITPRVSDSIDVNVSDFKLYLNGIETTTFTNTNAVSATVNMKLTATGGTTLSNGDVVTIPFLTTNSTTTASVIGTTATSMLYSDGTLVGEWRLISSKNIEIKLNSNVVGRTSLDIDLYTPATIGMRNYVAGTTSTEAFTVGNKTKNLTVTRPSLSSFNGSITRSSIWNITNQGGEWQHTFGNDQLYTLVNSGNIITRNNIIFESSYDLTSREASVNILGVFLEPISSSDYTPSNSAGHGFDCTSLFTKIEQNDNESYDTFKSRIGVRQYGCYLDAANKKTRVIINFGSNPNGIKYNDAPFLAGRTIGDYVVEKDARYAGYDPIKLRNYFNNYFGNNSAANGQILLWRVDVDVRYPTVLLDDTIESNVTITSNGTMFYEENKTATLLGLMSKADLGPTKSVTLYKTDTVTGEFLSGATFKLQRNTDGVWVDYTATSNTLEKTTDSSGKLQFTNLGTGTYRFVEETAPSGYDKSTLTFDKDTFVVTTDETEGRIILARNEKLPITSSSTLLTKNVGDTFIRPEGVTAENYKGVALTVSSSNTSSVHSIPNSSGKYTAAGTYSVEHTVTDTNTGQTSTTTQTIKVNGMPTITATPQSYNILNSNIASSVKANPKATSPVASDTIGATPSTTTISNDSITYTITSGPSGYSGFNKTGIYTVRYTATNPAGLTSTTTTSVLVYTGEASDGVFISASDFWMENKAAKSLTASTAKNSSHGNVSAYEETYDNSNNVSGYEVINTTNITVNDSQLAAIKNVGPTGNNFNLTFTATNPTTSKTVSMMVDVKVFGTDVVIVDGTIAINAAGFELSYNDAAKLTAAKAFTNGIVDAAKKETDSNEVVTVTDLTNSVTVNTAQLNAIIAAPTTGGIYALTYSVTADVNGISKTATKTISVLVKPLFYNEETGIIIGAEGFSLENEAAAELNNLKSLKNGNASAFITNVDEEGVITGFEDISGKIEIDGNELALIKKAPVNGGIYDLTYSVTDIVTRDGKEVEATVSKTVKVVVKGLNTPPIVETPDGDGLAITASDFTIKNHEAYTLTEARTIALSGAEAWLVSAYVPVEVTADADMLAAIKEAPKKGGVYDLTFTAAVVNSDESITTNEVTIKVTVLPVDGKSSPTSGTDTGDTTNVGILLLLAFLSLGVITRRKKKNT